MEEGGSAMETITTSLTGAITTAAGDAMDAIAAIVPVALPIMAAILVVTIGVRVFKKFAK